MSKKPTKADLQDQLNKLQAAHQERLHQLFKLENDNQKARAGIDHYKCEATKFREIAVNKEMQRIKERELRADGLNDARLTVRHIIEILTADVPFHIESAIPQLQEYEEFPF